MGSQILAIREGIKIWKPLPGPQTQAFFSPADFLFYGGAAGGGKTDLMLGVAYHNHTNSILFRRESPELRAIIERAQLIFDKCGEYNQSTKIWRFDKGTRLQFAGVQHEKDVKKWQGQPHDCILFDEISYFLEYMVRFLTGWLRHDNPANAHLRTRVIGAGNPPMNAEGQWIKRFFGPWLDKDHPNPAAPGELRYFTTINAKDQEVNGPDKILIKVKGKSYWIKPKSRTFIPAKVTDNIFMMQSGYMDQLAGLRESLRVRLLDGDFSVELDDHDEQLIPTEWVLMAQRRWRDKSVQKSAIMTALGADIARGGTDDMVLSPRFGNWLDKQITYPGKDVKDGDSAARKIAIVHRNGCPVYLDAVGIGAAAYDSTIKIISTTIPLMSAASSNGRDKTGLFGFVNKRAEWSWKFMERLDPKSEDPIALPDDDELRADLTSYRFKVTPQGIQIEKKEEIKKRLGRSPDKGDSCIYAFSDEYDNIPRVRSL